MFKIILLDRDGTINVDKGTPTRPEDIEMLPHVGSGLRRLGDPGGARFFIITNQSSIGRGADTMENYQECERRVEAMLREEGIIVERTYVCPHAKDAACDCRKPAIGMWEQLKKDFPDADAGSTLMIGNRDGDIGFGKKIGAKTARIRDGLHPETVEADYTVKDMDALADIILPGSL